MCTSLHDCEIISFQMELKLGFLEEIYILKYFLFGCSSIYDFTFFLFKLGCENAQLVPHTLTVVFMSLKFLYDSLKNTILSLRMLFFICNLVFSVGLNFLTIFKQD